MESLGAEKVLIDGSTREEKVLIDGITWAEKILIDGITGASEPSGPLFSPLAKKVGDAGKKF